MKFPVSTFLRDQYTKLPPIESMNTDFRGKTVIVSGSNTGLGLECARHIARMMGDGPDAGRLILACRNITKATNALNCMSFTLSPVARPTKLTGWHLVHFSHPRDHSL